MSDQAAEQPIAPEANPGSDPQARGGAETQRQAPEPSTLLGSDVQDDGAEQSQAEAKWRDDWRDAMLVNVPQKDREKERKRLERFADPASVYRAGRELERKFSSGQVKPVLADDASPEEVANYRKAAGIPEAPDGYEVSLPENLPVSDGDKAALDQLRASMHAAHATPAQVKAAVDTFAKAREAEVQRIHETAEAAKVEATVALRTEYGRDFGRNMRLANDFASSHGGENAKGLMQIPLADGTMLGNNPDFIRMLVNASLSTADDVALITSEPGRGGKSIDDEIGEIADLQFKDRKKYESDEVQSRLTKLYEAREKRRPAA